MYNILFIISENTECFTPFLFESLYRAVAVSGADKSLRGGFNTSLLHSIVGRYSPGSATLVLLIQCFL